MKAMIYTATILLGILAVSCGQSSYSEQGAFGSDDASSSELTSVGFQLPSTDEMATDRANADRGFSFRFKYLGSNLSEERSGDIVIDAAGNAKISITALPTGKTGEVTLDIFNGQTRTLSGTTPNVTLVVGQVNNVRIVLKKVDPNISVPTSPANPTAPSGTVPAVQLPADLNYSVKDSAGTEKKFSDLFGGKKYLLLDFSASNCGYCLTRAREINQDSALQARLTGNSCRSATVVPKSDLGNWKNVIKGFVGSHSYASSSARLSEIVTKYTGSFNGTPTFILIDQKGKVMGNVSHGVPSAAINQYCQ